jgi:hypothetical protein
VSSIASTRISRAGDAVAVISRSGAADVVRSARVETHNVIVDGASNRIEAAVTNAWKRRVWWPIVTRIDGAPGTGSSSASVRNIA